MGYLKEIKLIRRSASDPEVYNNKVLTLDWKLLGALQITHLAQSVQQWSGKA